jgi:kanamycin kinase
VWRNELGGQTWRLGDRYLKWSPPAAGIDLAREAERLRWLEGRHPAPRVLGFGHDGAGQWILTAALDAETAVSKRWRERPEPAVRAIAEGLRRLHALPVADVPQHWESWASRTPPNLGPRPAFEDPVLVHGDACSPNTLLDADGGFVANVDVGDLVVGDRWADLAVGAMSLEWNYGSGWDALFYEVYGVEPDPIRIAYYRALWDAES